MARIDWHTRRFEIIVVAALIVGLWFMLLFAFARARNIKRGELCQSNLRKLALAMAQYTRDYDEHHPLKDNWKQALFVWVRDDSFFHCPSTPQHGYAMNENLSGLSFSEISDFDTTLVFFETHLLRPNANGSSEAALREPRHPQGIGVGFVGYKIGWQQQPLQVHSFRVAKPDFPLSQ